MIYIQYVFSLHCMQCTITSFNHSFFQTKDWKFFHELSGRNIRLMNNGKTATRVESYNQGVVIASNPLERDVIFEVGRVSKIYVFEIENSEIPVANLQIKIDKLNTRWVSSLMIGVLCTPIARSSLPVTAFGFRKDVWLLSADSVYHNGHKVSFVFSKAQYI